MHFALRPTMKNYTSMLVVSCRAGDLFNTRAVARDIVKWYPQKVKTKEVNLSYLK